MWGEGVRWYHLSSGSLYLTRLVVPTGLLWQCSNELLDCNVLWATARKEVGHGIFRSTDGGIPILPAVIGFRGSCDIVRDARSRPGDYLRQSDSSVARASRAPALSR